MRSPNQDKLLADKIVALGVGHRSSADDRWYGTGVEIPDHHASGFVRDWRVAGALMEKCQAVFVEKLTEDVWACRADKAYGERTRNWHEDGSLPRAIIEACVRALERV